MIYKALSLTQPWATLVMLLEKRIETRSVLYSHRGTLAIHATSRLDEDAWSNPVFRFVLARHGINKPGQLPLGCILGLVKVVDGCRFDGSAFPKCVPPSWLGRVGQFEEHFGDYRARRGGLLFDEVDHFDEKPKARGMNGLWNWDDGKLAA